MKMEGDVFMVHLLVGFQRDILIQLVPKRVGHQHNSYHLVVIKLKNQNADLKILWMKKIWKQWLGEIL
jgi:hypothetical protein